MKPTGASASTFFVKRLAADALLQQGERRGEPRAVLPDRISPSSTVPSGSARAQRDDLRESAR